MKAKKPPTAKQLQRRINKAIRQLEGETPDTVLAIQRDRVEAALATLGAK